MRCKCGCMMTWHMDYVNGDAVCWYTCPSCGHDTRYKYTWSDRTYKEGGVETNRKNEGVFIGH